MAGDQKTRSAAIDALMANKSTSFEQVRPFLEDPDEWIRSVAIRLILDMGNPDGGRFLVPLLGDRSKMIRWEAAEALGTLEYQAAAGPLVASLHADPNSLVRLCAAEALGNLQIANPPSIDALVKAMQGDRAPLVRAYAAESLGRLAATATMPLIRERLILERNTRARASMLEALARLRDRGAVRLLLRMLERVKDWDVRRAIINLLRNLEEPENTRETAAFFDRVATKEPSFWEEEEGSWHERVKKLGLTYPAGYAG